MKITGKAVMYTTKQKMPEREILLAYHKGSDEPAGEAERGSKGHEKKRHNTPAVQAFHSYPLSIHRYIAQVAADTEKE